jgi:hypothetical protein
MWQAGLLAGSSVSVEPVERHEACRRAAYYEAGRPAPADQPWLSHCEIARSSSAAVPQPGCLHRFSEGGVVFCGVACFCVDGTGTTGVMYSRTP